MVTVTAVASHGVHPDRKPIRRRVLAAGLPTSAIRELLPCATATGLQHCDHTRKIMREGLSHLDAQIAELTRRRTLLARQDEQLVAAPYRSDGPA
ncbi:MerR family DNA-binding protein [Nocardia nova]|nr:MerR family DNA-binding protein [Nocardia nova]